MEVHNDLIENTDENYNRVMQLFNQYSSKLITVAQFQEETKNLLKQPNFFHRYVEMQMKYEDQLNGNANTTRKRQKSKQWTTADDEILSNAVAEFGTSDWGAVAERFGNTRTRSQCAQRWKRVLDPNINKGNWTTPEEEKLLFVVGKVGEKSWTRVAKEMGNRTDVQCRFKYFQIKERDGAKANPYVDQINAQLGASQIQMQGNDVPNIQLQLPATDGVNSTLQIPTNEGINVTLQVPTNDGVNSTLQVPSNDSNIQIPTLGKAM